MRILRDYTGLDGDDRGASVAIGNFDGVHTGHRTVIALATDKAARLGVPSGVLTFEPHPRQYFAPDTPPFRLMNAEARANRLARLGVQRLYELPFDDALAGLSAEAFAHDVLHRGIGARHVVIGADFRFGKGRAGDAAAMQRFGDDMGFAVTIARMVETNGTDVSSTRIREALSDGRPADAAAMLGHLHRIEGPVLHGAKRGRELGYPTANMSIAGLHPPAHGVYAVTVEILDGPQAGHYGGVASLGVRPMFGVNEANIETHIFDFIGDLYGRHLSVGLVAWLRGEEKFGSLDALIAQMHDDSARARRILAAA
ncbi:riboflavin biosynthesis protein RibF [Oceaniovalibus guishaninsula JLT2003]|uniref:Riboflavin biosynthesis protein n=1 Tax=Oceaniovalibus guishaninsula JLT2003 TaxID=1231392 RepID=K2I5I5_9RHOB|nr:bifunctional riboflavin kinase/FAD synthetase [Oceaniovalibus guishaninsula]EKE44150.1 riboflavin biosynthesis protein RibF [Oceaniovalibus guishaninsula JLT2003]